MTLCEKEKRVNDIMNGENTYKCNKNQAIISCGYFLSLSLLLAVCVKLLINKYNLDIALKTFFEAHFLCFSLFRVNIYSFSVSSLLCKN